MEESQSGKSGGIFNIQWNTNWLERLRPKLKSWNKKNNYPENLWETCPSCNQLLHHQELKKNLRICSHCDHHLQQPPHERFQSLFNNGEYETLPEVVLQNADPLKFRDSKKYTDRLKDARAKTKQKDAIIVAHGKMGGDMNVVIAVQNFAFMGGSMGVAAGESIIRGVNLAIETTAPFIIFSSAGGARMQEGILSLMQMARTTAAINQLRDARLPFISVMTDPTTGGVVASYAMLGDINIAEPNARIGFAGRRVIEQTIRETLPAGFQRSEFLLQHGMLDMITHRKEMRNILIKSIAILTNHPPNLATQYLGPPATK